MLAVEGCIFERLFLWGEWTHPLCLGRKTSTEGNTLTIAKAVYLHFHGSNLQCQKCYNYTKVLSGHFLHRNWINRGINIPVNQLTVRCCVMFTFPLLTHIVVNTVVSWDCVVTMVAVLITVVIQLCVLHWPLLRGIQSPQHMYSRVRSLNILVWDESKMSNGSETYIQL